MDFSTLQLTEYQECRLFWDWLCASHPRVAEMTHHSPAELAKHKGNRIAQAKIGMSSGYPDYAIHVPNGQYHSLFLEMKKEDKKNHAMPENQIAWLERLRSHGHMACFAFGFDDAMEIVTNYLNNQ